MGKNKTPTQKYIDQAAKAAAEQATTTSISNCEFVGVKFDEKACEAINTIAEGLVENAKALGQLANVLSASGVNLECMLKIDGKQ